MSSQSSGQGTARSISARKTAPGAVGLRESSTLAPAKVDWHMAAAPAQGVLDTEFESDALYLTREHRNLHIFTNAVRLYLRDEGWDISDIATHDGQYVTIEAKVDAYATGSLSVFPAALVEIGEIRVVE